VFPRDRRAAHARLLEDSVQRANLPLIGSFIEEGNAQTGVSQR